MRPHCYRQYSAHPRAGCGGCVLRGPCAACTSHAASGYTILHHPRFIPPESCGFALVFTQLPPTAFEVRMRRANLRKRGEWWVHRGRRIARVVSCNAEHIELEFAALGPFSLQSVRGADLGDFAPVFDQAARKPRGSVTKMHLRTGRILSGTKAVFADQEAAADFLASVVVACYSNVQ